MPAHAWTVVDDAVIRLCYPTERADLLAAFIGITRQQLYWRAQKLGMKKPHTGRFAPGRQSANAMPVGSTRKSTRHGYLFVKVKEGGWPDAWRQAHHILWEEAHGPIPPGHIVAFKDGNTENVVLENLELMSKAEWMATRVSVENRLPPEVAGIIRIKAALTRHINTIRKERNEQQQGG